MISKKEDLNKPFWTLPVEEVLKDLDTTAEGLGEEEIKRRISIFGNNVLPGGKRITTLGIFLSQFKSPIIFVLIFAAVVTIFLKDYKDAGFIIAAILVNSALGFYQENKAETTLANLQSYIKERVRVIRDNHEVEIDAEEIIPGDILRLTQGTRIPADARIISANNLMVDESVLTGESLAVDKSIEPVSVATGLSDRKSMVFAGTFIEEGLGLAAIIAIGRDTEVGKIALLVKEEPEKTPLQTAMAKFAKHALAILMFLSALLFLVGVGVGYGFFQMFIISVAVAVAAVPEGLPVALTVILAVGVERLARRKGIVRKLLAAETLGSTTVILTDKTGTLTEAKMELSQIIPAERTSKEDLLELAVSTVDAIVENSEENPDKWRVVGRPLEAALVRAAAAHKVLIRDVSQKFKVIDRRPFNSEDKYGAVYIDRSGKKFWSYLGAPERLLEKTKSKKEEKEHFYVAIDDLAYAGYRVLGAATDDKFLGILAFRDPIRPSVKDTVQKIREAGVRTVILTGDHKGTAESVAKDVGITAAEDEILTGDDLQKIDEDELSRRLDKIKIFARIAPEDKLRITQLYEKKGEIVAMTGDGVNDAPALKAADIGVAVGSGTDVAKAAADLIILDGNFETIVEAIIEGRRMLSNIKKVIVYLLSDSLDELFLIGGSIIIGLPLPLNALQILFVNFFADSFPAVAFAFEDGENHLKTKPPKLKERLFDPEMRFLILVLGVLTSFLLFIMYVTLLRLGFPADIVKTFIFASFALYTLFLTFSIRSLKTSIIRYNPFSNIYLVVGVLIGFGLTSAAIYLPSFQSLFGTTPLPFLWVLGVISFGLFNIITVEIVKFFFRNR